MRFIWIKIVTLAFLVDIAFMEKWAAPTFLLISNISQRGESERMKNEFVLAFNEVLEEKQLPKEVILKALESAMVSAYRRAVNASNAQHVEAKIDPDSGHVTILAEKEVVEQVGNPSTEVDLAGARAVNPEAELGDLVVVESTPHDFGRVAAQTARQVIQQRIREAERSAQMEYFNKQMGEITTGVVQAVNATATTIGLDLKAEGTLPKKEMIPGERFRVHERVRAILLEVKDSSRGPQIILSRAHRNFLRRLLETEVPEIYHGVVEIRSIAREPGQRAKVAVAATQQGIDPVGACVGIRGVRIQAIVRELHDEKIDVIEWNNDPAVYISKAISPARTNGVYLNDMAEGGKTATVVVPEDQLSLAIGRDGQNARLAAKLTGWRIDIKKLDEAAADSLTKLHEDPVYAAIAEVEADIIPQVEAALAKKKEGRPLGIDENDLLSRFVDRVERKSAIKRQAEKKPEEIRRQQIVASLPPSMFEMPVDELKFSDHITSSLLEAGMLTVGDLAVQYRIDPDVILALQGMSPKALADIETALSERRLLEIVQPVPVIETPEVEEKPVEVAPEVVETKSEENQEPVVVEAAPVMEEEVEEELPADLGQIFAMKPEAFEAAPSTEEEESEEDKKNGGKKKKKKHVEIEYDPERDMVMVHKKHKRGGEWGDW
jgi:transcription termination/antitermination protein NusA